jgi:outer membrane protein
VNAFDRRWLSLLLAPALLALPDSSTAAEGDWFFRAGIHAVDPTSGNGTLAGGALRAEVESGIRPTLAIGRHLSPRWAVELLAALPFTHTASLNGVDALEFKHLPPTLTLQHYFAPDAKVNPYLGVGLNYTWTFDEQERGPLAGTKTRLGNSFGPSLQAGLVFDTGKRWNIIADVRWADIDADVSVDGADVGTVNVDPLVYGVFLGWKF